MSMMRIDPFREFDRLSQQMLRGTLARPVALSMDAWKEGDEFFVEFDIPGVDPSSIDLDIERNVLTVRAERGAHASENAEILAEERPRGSFIRQVILSDNLDPEGVQARYESGVLSVRIPVVEQAKPRRIEISSEGDTKELSV